MCAMAHAIFGPLSFPEPEKICLPFEFSPWEERNVECIFCKTQFFVPKECDAFSAHLRSVHRIFVANLESVVSIKGYVDFWRIRFSQTPVNEICPRLGQDGDYYFLLSPETNVEDISLRGGLATKRLEWVLEAQRLERSETNYDRGCLFCRHTEKGTRADYLTHLAYQHNLQLGRPDNLVFIDKLIDKIEGKLKELKCIYCELVFRDRETLKEHMRKKFHKRINPKNCEYDRFYVNSYIEGGKDDKDDERNGADSWQQWREEGSDWSDWREDPRPIVCLFCSQSFTEWELVLQHMHDVHKFSYNFVMGSYDYYEQVKIVNFIRRERHLGRCYECKTKVSSEEELITHMNMEKHCTIPDRSDWDHPEFYFPTYENDAFLCFIEDNEEDPIDSLTSQMSNMNNARAEI